MNNSISNYTGLNSIPNTTFQSNPQNSNNANNLTFNTSENLSNSNNLRNYILNQTYVGLVEGTMVICDEGWQGEECNIRICKSNCSNNGICDNGTCLCSDNYAGEQCEVIIYDS